MCMCTYMLAASSTGVHLPATCCMYVCVCVYACAFVHVCVNIHNMQVRIHFGSKLHRYVPEDDRHCQRWRVSGLQPSHYGLHNH